ncbi:MAG: hypothetical protein HY200_09115 [Nitrospirae bacterium]|nr:hypothetical protein [Nitrospirota bacterium]
MKFPFTLDQFLEVFEKYNRAIQPIQFVAYILAIGAILVSIKRISQTDKIITGILAAFWLLMGFVYFIGYFSVINRAAYLFGAFFIIQALLFVYFGNIKQHLSFKLMSGIPPVIGAIFIAYALVVYPIFNYYFGHIYPRMPVFGVAPCPTTIFTFGILLWATERVPIYLIVIPLLWSFIGVSAAINLGIKEDFGLVIAGIVGFTLILVNNQRLGISN